MGRVMATTSVPAILAPAVGPVVGALLISEPSWHWLFLVNVPTGVLGLVVGLRTVPRGDTTGAGRLDGPGLALVAVGLPLLTYAITEAAASRTLLAPSVAPPLAGGVPPLLAFVRRSLRSAAPLLDLRLFRNRGYAAASFEVLFNGAALFGGLIVMPLYFQLQCRAGIVETGLLLTAFSLGAAATFPVAGRLADRHGGGIVTLAGLVVTTLSTVALALSPADVDLVTVELLMVARGIGLALSGMPAVSAAFATVSARQLPDATSQITILSRVGGAIGGAVFVVILTGALPAGVAAAFRLTFWSLTAATLAALVGATWLVREQRRAATEEGS